MNRVTYDLAIAYRIYPGVSKVPFIFPEDKFKLAEVGIKTLQSSLGDAKAKIFFLLDNCPPRYQEMISKYFSQEDIEFIHYGGIGNLATFGKQIDLLLNQTASEIIFFAEDDYVYRPDLLKSAVSLLRARECDFVTPYDHLDSYILPIHTRHQYSIGLHGGLHWRTSASTCLTFLTSKKTLRATEDTFRSYCIGNWDSSLWFALTKKNVFSVSLFIHSAFTDRFIFKMLLLSWIKCWKQILFGKRFTLMQPIPSIATHMEKVSLAPNIDWTRFIGVQSRNES